MSFELDNTALDFETMLRRHLRNGGAPVSACAGFDTDTASAYLEGALSSESRSLYESHLAGCPACRHHVIDLGRLSHLVLQADPQPVPVTARSGSLGQWSSAIGQRFGRWWESPAWTAWGLDWRLAGTALAAGAVFIVMIVVKPWHQTIRPVVSVTPAVITHPQHTPASLPDPSTLPSPELSIVKGTPDRTPAPAPTRTAVPPPVLPLSAGSHSSIEPQRDAINPTEILSTESNKRKLMESPAINTVALPPPPRTLNFAESKPAQLTAESTDNSRTERQGAISLEAGAAQYKAPVEPEFTPSPADHPMRIIASAEKRQNPTKNEKASQPAGRADWLSRAKGYVPFRNTNDSKEPPAHVEDEEDSKPLIQHIRGKTFWYQRKIWVDREYNPEKMYWRVKRIAHGSQEYERVLAEEPQLEQFFKLGQIIIVWRDKVYRVTNQ